MLVVLASWGKGTRKVWQLAPCIYVFSLFTCFRCFALVVDCSCIHPAVNDVHLDADGPTVREGHEIVDVREENPSYLRGDQFLLW